MLKQEYTPKTNSVPYTPWDRKEVMPQELARAIVAVEARRESASASVAPCASLQRTITDLGVNTTPERLLEEVQRERLQKHQSIVMTPHKTRGAAFWLLLSGCVVFAAMSLFLLFTSYIWATRLSEMSQELAARSTASTSTPTYMRLNAVADNQPVYATLPDILTLASGKIAPGQISVSTAYDRVGQYGAEWTVVKSHGHYFVRAYRPHRKGTRTEQTEWLHSTLTDPATEDTLHIPLEQFKHIKGTRRSKDMYKTSQEQVELPREDKSPG